MQGRRHSEISAIRIGDALEAGVIVSFRLFGGVEQHGHAQYFGHLRGRALVAKVQRTEDERIHLLALKIFG
ncbi:MAG TPA: hypothetical protein VM141_04900, partial [Planctomycetota bacterium]|nr:hypothetical protein [Planctomycetota bacterium]